MNRLKKFLGIAALILFAAGAQPALSGVWQWSKTANNNATADPTINWAEGMSPSSVNDSARAMMAQIANYRDDISGLLTTGGISTAYTVASNSILCSASSTPADGQLISATMSVTNGAAPTLQVDSCSAFPIQSSPASPVASGTLILGSPYSFKYSVANSAWMLKGFYSNPTSVPLGAMMPFTLTTSPNSNFVIPMGQCLSTTTYASYWTALGSPASGSCPGGQFQIIDMSGSIPAGLDTMPGGAAANRLTSAATGCGTAFTSIGTRCANGNQSHTLLTAEIPSHSHGVTDPGHNHTINAGSSGSGTIVTLGVGAFGTITANNPSTTGISIQNAGGGGAHSIVPPVIGVTYLLRVL